MSNWLPLLSLLGLAVACTESNGSLPDPPDDAGPIDPGPDADPDPGDVARLAILAPTTELPVGVGMSLGVIAFDGDGAIVETPAVTWSTSALSVVSVNENGEVAARTPGVALITARHGAIRTDLSLTVVEHATAVFRVAITPSADRLEAGATAQLTATTYDENDDVLQGRLVTWTSSMPYVATVSPTGAVSALHTGSTTITASSEGQTAAITVTVYEVDHIDLAPGDAKIMYAQTTRQLTATAYDNEGSVIIRPFTWESANPGIAHVSPTGLVTAVSNGQAFVRVSAGGAVTFVLIRVHTIASMTISETDAIVSPAQPLQLRTTVVDTNNQPINDSPAWTSSAPAVATVDGTGKVTGHTDGTATITASLGGRTVSSRIVVASWKDTALSRVNGAALPGILYAYGTVRMDVDQGALVTRDHDASFQLFVMGPRYENGVRVGYRDHNTAGRMFWNETTQTYRFVPDAYPAGPAFTGRKVPGGIEITYQPDPAAAPAVLLFAP